jgi:L-asparaginase II
VTVLAEVTRSGVVESRHHGSLVGLAADGSTALSLGRPEVAVFGRSSNKPLQAVAMLTAGLVLPSELLVLTASSHSGERDHIVGVRQILDGAHLTEDDLRNTPDWPLDEACRNAAIRDGVPKTPLQQNCSGKHASMLATCVIAGWPLDGYLDPNHPLQRHITATVERLTGEKVAHIGIDGCGAPVHATSLIGLARAFRTLALASPDTAEGQVATAMRLHPHLLGGTGRDVTVFIEEIPGLIAKDGAEGVYAAATSDGRAVALKVEDGAWRSRATIIAAALQALGVDIRWAAERTHEVALGHGQPVGEIRAVGISEAVPRT